MRFHLNQSLQCREIEYSIKARLYSRLLHVSRYKVIRLTGPGVGIVSSFLTIASRIGLIMENMIKGIANIAGVPFSKKCSVKKGCQQLFANTPGHIVAIPYTFVFAILELGSKTISMAINPEKYCAEKHSKFTDKEDFK